MHPKLSLAIEPIEEDSDNIKTEKEKTCISYEKNGFETLDTRVVEMGVEFELWVQRVLEIEGERLQITCKEVFLIPG